MVQPTAKRTFATPTVAGGLGAAASAVGLILAAVMHDEGGYVDHPYDPGGKTNHGITEATARACGYRGDMKDLSRARAAECYETLYVQRPGFGAVVAMDPWVGKKVIDTGVNTGTPRTSCWFQQTLNAFNRGGRDYADLKVDCQVGPATLAAFDKLRARRGTVKACQLVIKGIEAKQAAHYLSLGERDAKFESFIPGWMDNRVGNVPVASCGTKFQ